MAHLIRFVLIDGLDNFVDDELVRPSSIKTDRSSSLTIWLSNGTKLSSEWLLAGKKMYNQISVTFIYISHICMALVGSAKQKERSPKANIDAHKEMAWKRERCSHFGKEQCLLVFQPFWIHPCCNNWNNSNKKWHLGYYKNMFHHMQCEKRFKNAEIISNSSKQVV